MQKKKVTERNIAGNKKKFRKRTGILLLMMLLLLNATVPVSAKSKARFTTATRITAKVLDGLDLQKVDKVMIVAHPDDEMLWGGMHLIQDDYLVVCLTNANTRTYGRTRMREFKKVMEKTGDIGLMLNYPDYSNRGGIADWTSCSDQIRKDIDTLLAYKNWKEVVTHNKKGEYGHKHHKKTNRIVTGAFEKAKLTDATLKYFGKYHGRKYNKPSKYTRAQLRQKRKIVRLYRSQRSIYTFAHMNGYEDWITVK